MLIWFWLVRTGTNLEGAGAPPTNTVAPVAPRVAALTLPPTGSASASRPTLTATAPRPR